MAGHRINSTVLCDTWEFDTQEEAWKAAEELEKVCGDDQPMDTGYSVAVFNFHQNSWRWVGYYG